MSPTRQPAQWSKTVEMGGFIQAMMGKQKKNLVVFIWSWFLTNCEASKASGKERRLLAGCTRWKPCMTFLGRGILPSFLFQVFILWNISALWHYLKWDNSQCLCFVLGIKGETYEMEIEVSHFLQRNMFGFSHVYYTCGEAFCSLTFWICIFF